MDLGAVEGFFRGPQDGVITDVHNIVTLAEVIEDQRSLEKKLLLG